MRTEATTQKLINTAAIGIAGAQVAKLVHYHFLSDSAKFALNNSRKSLDTFVAEAGQCAGETIKNSNLKIDLAKVKENAIKMYETVAKEAPQAVKAIKKTGMIAGIGIAGVAALYNFVIAPKKSK